MATKSLPLQYMYRKLEKGYPGKTIFTIGAELPARMFSTNTGSLDDDKNPFRGMRPGDFQAGAGSLYSVDSPGHADTGVPWKPFEFFKEYSYPIDEKTARKLVDIHETITKYFDFDNPNSEWAKFISDQRISAEQNGVKITDEHAKRIQQEMFENYFFQLNNQTKFDTNIRTSLYTCNQFLNVAIKIVSKSKDPATIVSIVDNAFTDGAAKVQGVKYCLEIFEASAMKNRREERPLKYAIEKLAKNYSFQISGQSNQLLGASLASVIFETSDIDSIEDLNNNGDGLNQVFTEIFKSTKGFSAEAIEIIKASCNQEMHAILENKINVNLIFNGSLTDANEKIESGLDFDGRIEVLSMALKKCSIFKYENEQGAEESQNSAIELIKASVTGFAGLSHDEQSLMVKEILNYSDAIEPALYAITEGLNVDLNAESISENALKDTKSLLLLLGMEIRRKSGPRNNNIKMHVQKAGEQIGLVNLQTVKYRVNRARRQIIDGNHSSSFEDKKEAMKDAVHLIELSKNECDDWEVGYNSKIAHELIGECLSGFRNISTHEDKEKIAEYICSEPSAFDIIVKVIKEGIQYDQNDPKGPASVRKDAQSLLMYIDKEIQKKDIWTQAKPVFQQLKQHISETAEFFRNNPPVYIKPEIVELRNALEGVSDPRHDLTNSVLCETIRESLDSFQSKSKIDKKFIVQEICNSPTAFDTVLKILNNKLDAPDAPSIKRKDSQIALFYIEQELKLREAFEKDPDVKQQIMDMEGKVAAAKNHLRDMTLGASPTKPEPAIQQQETVKNESANDKFAQESTKIQSQSVRVTTTSEMSHGRAVCPSAKQGRARSNAVVDNEKVTISTKPLRGG